MKEWTIMVYMAGDNNLSEEMIRSINEIKSGSAQGETQNRGPINVNFVVQYDGLHPNVKTRRYYDFFDMSLPFDELNNAEEKVLIETKIKDFVIYSINKKPAGNYALILSGHTDAFQGRTLLADENPPGIATIEKLRECLKKEIVDKTIGNKPAGSKLKILGFDSCVMNTFEVMYEFKEIAEVWVGSQGSIPNYTWDYKSIALELVSKQSPQTLTTEYIANTIVQKTKFFNKDYAFGGRSIDISASYLTDTEEVENGIGKLAEKLIELIYPPETNWHKLVLRMLLNVHWKCQTFMLHQSMDLKDFCINLKEECQQVKTELNDFCHNDEENIFFADLDTLCEICDDLICKIEEMVFEIASTGLEYRSSNGLSLFFPWSILAMKMTFENYIGEVDEKGVITKGLKFPKTENGLVWFLFIFIVLVYTVKYDKEVILSAQKKVSPQLFKNNSFSEKINLLILTVFAFLSESTGHRDDQPRSRGLNAFASYFGEIKNLGLELDPPNDSKKHCSK